MLKLMTMFRLFLSLQIPTMQFNVGKGDIVPYNLQLLSLLFVCLCHWADQSLDSFTGSITCESVWKFWLITGAYLSGERQERELIETGEPELTIRRLCESSAKYKDVKESEEMEFKNHARLLGDA